MKQQSESLPELSNLVGPKPEPIFGVATVLWAHNSKLDITSCTIITEPSAEPLNEIHDRQPLILDPAFYDAWLNPETPAVELKDILSHDIDGQLQVYRVGRDVSAAAINMQPNDHAWLIEPIKML